MLEAFKDRDVVLLGVNSDAVLDTIVQAKERERLDYRTWWDGHSQPEADLVAAEGPIATQWNVVGWPTIYVIDDEGVIRHADKRGGALVAAVDKLLDGQDDARFRSAEGGRRGQGGRAWGSGGGREQRKGGRRRRCEVESQREGQRRKAIGLILRAAGRSETGG